MATSRPLRPLPAAPTSWRSGAVSNVAAHASGGKRARTNGGASWQWLHLLPHGTPMANRTDQLSSPKRLQVIQAVHGGSRAAVRLCALGFFAHCPGPSASLKKAHRTCASRTELVSSDAAPASGRRRRQWRVSIVGHGCATCRRTSVSKQCASFTLTVPIPTLAGGCPELQPATAAACGHGTAPALLLA